MSTLYISDLDGTLLHSDATLSRFTASAVNSLVERGMMFSYATARSYVSAKRVTEGLCESLPVIIFNGTFIISGGTGKLLWTSEFSAQETEYIVNTLTASGVYPFVHRTVAGAERFVYLPGELSRGGKKFEAERLSDVRRCPVDRFEALFGEGAFHFTCIDEKERLEPLFESLKASFECHFYLDPYSREYWLEVQPKNATKANAALELKRLLGCSRLVCFGDALNDYSMFEVADECYAVENGCEYLKNAATDVILSNDDDGVAKWLLKNYKE